MVLSQNGWPASRDPGAIRVNTDFRVNGVAFPNGVRSGDVETIFRYLCERFHATVEPLDSGSCWGYYYKPIEGSSTISNHASGTAVDLNAPAHPMGVRGTFTPAKRAAIRAILTYLNGVVRWGGDYIGRADEMHFEINADTTAVAKVAAKIRLEEVREELDAITRDAIHFTDNRMEAIVNGRDKTRTDLPKGGGEQVWLVTTLKRIETRLAAIEAKLNTL